MFEVLEVLQTVEMSACFDPELISSFFVVRWYMWPLWLFCSFSSGWDVRRCCRYLHESLSPDHCADLQRLRHPAHRLVPTAQRSRRSSRASSNANSLSLEAVSLLDVRESVELTSPSNVRCCWSDCRMGAQASWERRMRGGCKLLVRGRDG